MRTFTLTVLRAPTLRPGGDPNDPDGVVWPSSGALVQFDLAELVSFFAVRHFAIGKFCLPYFLVGAFRDGVRRNSAFLFASVVALDVEGGPTTMEAHERFRGWCHLMYTTWSHRPDAHRFRVVFPLSRDVSAEEYKLLWLWLARMLGSGADPQTKDLARALFLAPERPNGSRAASKAWDAPLLDPDAVLPEARELARPLTRRVPPRPPMELPTWAARREARLRLTTDAEARRRAAEYLGAKVGSTRADDIPCPQCGRPSVWFWLEPGKMRTARCKHQNSCAWWGHLDDLLDTSGSRHE